MLIYSIKFYFIASLISESLISDVVRIARIRCTISFQGLDGPGTFVFIGNAKTWSLPLLVGWLLLLLVLLLLVVVVYCMSVCIYIYIYIYIYIDQGLGPLQRKSCDANSQWTPSRYKYILCIHIMCICIYMYTYTYIHICTCMCCTYIHI